VIETLGSEPVQCEIFSLSPSDSATLASKIDFAKLLPEAGNPKRWVQPLTQNRAAVVIRLRIGNFSAILGADLEEGGSPQTGWSAILSAHSSDDGKASVFKVPHHGSASAHHDRVWQDMLEDKPIALLTPFQNGNRNLPTDNDVRRLVSFTPDVFMTCKKEKRNVKRDRTVERAIKDAAKSIRMIGGSFGHARIRFQSPNSATVELYGDAYRLELPAQASSSGSQKSKSKT
jgi:hypothetical protein